MKDFESAMSSVWIVCISPCFHARRMLIVPIAAKFDHSSVSSDLTVATSTEAAVPSYTDSSAMVTASMDEPEPTSTGDEGLGNLGSMMN